jgi:hypothetical protein
MQLYERVPGTDSDMRCRIYPISHSGECNVGQNPLQAEASRGRNVGLVVYTLYPAISLRRRRTPRMCIVPSGGTLQGGWTAA